MSRRGTCGRAGSRFASRRWPSRRATRRNGRASQWNGEVETLSQDTTGAPLLIDALFGTGLKRGLERCCFLQLSRLAHEAVVAVACDLPSGVETDCGADAQSRCVIRLTVTFGALKPAHRLHPAMHKCGRVVLGDIGIEADAEWHEIGAADASAARSRRATNMTAGWSMRWRGRCRARSRLRPRRRRIRVPAMSGSAPRGRSTGCRRRSSRSTRAEVNDERIGCLLVGPGMGDVPQLLTLALTSRGAQGHRRRRDRRSWASPDG